MNTAVVLISLFISGHNENVQASKVVYFANMNQCIKD